MHSVTWKSGLVSATAEIETLVRTAPRCRPNVMPMKRQRRRFEEKYCDLLHGGNQSNFSGDHWNMKADDTPSVQHH